MNRFIFTSLIIVKLLISIHSHITNEKGYAYNEISGEMLKPIGIEHKLDYEAMNDDMKKSLESSLINLADVSSTALNYYYYGNQLNTFEKKIYERFDKLCQTPIKNITTEFFNIAQYKIAISNLENTLSKAFFALKYDHPDYFWLNGGYRYTYYPIPGNLNYVDKIQISLTIIDYENKYINNNYDKVTNIAKTVANNAKKQTTLYKRIKYIHDYLATNIKYGYVKADLSRYDIAGCLLNKRCVCQGYALTFSYICRLANIEAIVIQGTTKRGERHFWNYVKIDNVWYLVDVTFDDPGDNEPGVASDNYTFFLIGWGDKYYKENYDKREALSKGLKYPTLSETNYKRPNLV